MTDKIALDTNRAAAAPSPKPWRTEIKALLMLGIPMGLTQLVQFSINTVDVLMIGRLGSEALAASSQGLVIFYVAYLIGIGPAMAITPMVSQALGGNSDNVRDARRSVRMGLWAVACLFPMILCFFVFAGDIIIFMGQPEVLARRAAPYVLALAPGWPFMIGVLILRNFLATIDRTRVPLLIILATTGVNAFLNFLLIYGSWGFPRLELVGAGIASSLAHLIGFVSFVGYIQWDKAGRRFDLFTRIYQPDWERLKEIVRLGWPIGVTIAFEALLFNACIFLMGRIGVDEVAAYQVALNFASLAFMMPLGLSMAGATRVGLAQGAGDHEGVSRAAIVSIGGCTVAIMIAAIPMGLAPEFIAGLYLEADDPGNAVVLALAASFLPVAAAFALFDAVQVAAAQALRGLKDVDIPMALAGVSYWLVGFPVAWQLALNSPVGAIGVWYGLLASLIAASLLLGGRLWWKLRR